MAESSNVVTETASNFFVSLSHPEKSFEEKINDLYSNLLEFSQATLLVLFMVIDALRKTQPDAFAPYVEFPESDTHHIGDTHGNAEAMLAQILYGVSLGEDVRIIGLGDYTDRGKHSLLTLVLMYVCKLLRPSTVVLVGNHELYVKHWVDFGTYEEIQLHLKDLLCREATFELMRKLKLDTNSPRRVSGLTEQDVAEVLMTHNKGTLPFSTPVPFLAKIGSVMFVHGMIPARPKDLSIGDLNRLEYDDPILSSLRVVAVNGDLTPEDELRSVRPGTGMYNCSESTIKERLAKWGASMLVRGHEYVTKRNAVSYPAHTLIDNCASTSKQKCVITVFASTNYCGSGQNAVLSSIVGGKHRIRVLIYGQDSFPIRPESHDTWVSSMTEPCDEKDAAMTPTIDSGDECDFPAM